VFKECLEIVVSVRIAGKLSRGGDWYLLWIVLLHCWISQTGEHIVYSVGDSAERLGREGGILTEEG
jgi:hypothetical protein